MTAKDLKNALLQEAVQGKLVPQIKSEGNARDLLEQIKKERGESLPLATERKRSSATPSAGTPRNAPLPISEDEIPFDIPESWCWCKIGEIFNLQAGKTISASDISETSNGNDYLCYGGNGIRGYVKNYNRDGYFPLIGRQGALCGNINFAKGKFYATEHAVVVETFANTNIDWAGVFLKALNLNQYATATAQPGLAVRNINEVYIPLPPLAEQKRIVEVIEKFMPLIEEYGKKEAVLKELNANIGTLTKKAILQEAVQGKLVPQIPTEGNAKDFLEQIKAQKANLIKEGKIKKEKPLPEITEDEIPFDIPENWCWCRLSDFCNLYTGNSINETEKKTKYTNLKEGRYYIGTKDVGFDSTIDYDNGVKIPFDNDKFRIADKDTILMCIEGGSAGRKIAFTNQPVCFGNKLCCFDAYTKKSIFFLYYFMQSTLFTDLFKDNMNGIIGGVSVNTLKTMLLPLPPLAEQKRIVAAIEQLLPLCEKLGK